MAVEDEIDVREYLRLLAAHWKLILGLGVLTAAVVLVIKLALPAHYEAEALVSVAPAQYSLQLEGVAVGQPIPVRTYPDLALSSEILQEVFTDVRDRLPPEVVTLSQFRRLVSARPASDPSLLRLTVRSTDPVLAADIANAWASLFTVRAAQLVAHDETNLATYQQQLTQAKVAMDAADAALAAFQSRNQANFLSAQLASQQAVLTDSLTRDYRISLLVDDAEELLGRLEALSASAPANLAEDVALLEIMTGVYGSQALQSAEGSAPAIIPAWQIQLGTGQPLAGPRVADQRALAEDLLATLNARREQMAADLEQLEPTILALQGALAEARVTETDLHRARDLAEGHYRTLSAKIEEAKIAVSESSNSIQVASRAVVPTERLGTRTLLSSAVAGLLGLLVGMVLVLFADYWRKGAPAPQPALTASALPSAD